MTSSRESANATASGGPMVLTAERGVVDGRLTGPIAVHCSGGRIEQVVVGADVDESKGPVEPGTLTAGLVDAQVNGGMGIDLVDADRDGWRTVGDHLATHGVTSYCPTAITAPIDDLLAFAERAAQMRDELKGQATAQPLGAHLEGPYLSPDRAGAHPRARLTEPAEPSVRRLIEAAESGALIMVTLAPEVAGCVELTGQLSARGVAVSLGHTDATTAVTVDAVDAGATWVTHLFNAQRPLHHREPGIIGRALTEPRLTCGLIADGHHVADEIVQLAFAAAGDRIALVSDAVAAAGMPRGTYRLGDTIAHLTEDGPPRTGDGTLAGSALTLDEAVRHVISLGIDPATAVAAATSVPARGLGHTDLGDLQSGARADIVRWDESWHVTHTWIAGSLSP